MNPTLLDCCRQHADEFRNSPRAGPYWAIKHQYAALYDEVVCLQAHIEQKSIETAEGMPMKIKLSYDELKKIVEDHLNEHIVKAPVIVGDLYILNNQGDAVEWDEVELDCQPKEQQP